MAISTLAAVAIGAGALGSAAISSSAAGKASRAASDAADQSAQVQREVYSQNAQTLAPYVQGGNAAGSQINALLGLSSGPDYAAYVQANPDILADFQKQSATGGSPSFDGGSSSFADVVGGIVTRRNGGGATPAFTGDMAAFGQQHWQKYGQNENRTLPTGQDAATQAFDQFRNSTGYQFRLGEGMNALNSGYAGAGTIKSGAAMRAANEYGQNFASAEFGNYLNALGNQQGVGLSAAGAQAGVGTNYANSMAQINDQRATGVGNAALANAGKMNSLIGTLGAGILKYG